MCVAHVSKQGRRSGTTRSSSTLSPHERIVSVSSARASSRVSK
ncbi:hypothetical protein JI435_423430 [Parastagonospora nodorum SN15]|uniref:Uncharacterized protein n=1 Tax=Phaeosphaeria nodorum (strain SN15 / ATCC MYA-4574 / FGSC 10173) TaxID=321614 RepID=A0A7U2NQE5_PHANO|nr:hypothetical protein JI435_423430 [Parastagonospora nodorum SN15]